MIDDNVVGGAGCKLVVHLAQFEQVEVMTRVVNINTVKLQVLDMVRNISRKEHPGVNFCLIRFREYAVTEIRPQFGTRLEYKRMSLVTNEVLGKPSGDALLATRAKADGAKGE
jgi:hypothetical protein